MVIGEVIKKTVGILRESGQDNAMFDAHLIIRTVLDMSPLDLVLGKKSEIKRDKEKEIFNIVDRYAKGEPLQYILGTQEFMALTFKVTPDVLIPRSDTETLVEAVIDRFKNKGASVLDIGVGSGCIGISLAYYNKRMYVRGLDISEKALAVAEENAENNGVNERVKYEKCDILTENLYGRYDAIVSNPPYIETDVIPTLDTNVKCYEPHLALDGGADELMFYRRITEIAPKSLNENGILAFEVGHTQAGAVRKMMEKNFKDIEIINDLCGIERVVIGVKK